VVTTSAGHYDLTTFKNPSVSQFSINPSGDVTVTLAFAAVMPPVSCSVQFDGQIGSCPLPATTFVAGFTPAPAPTAGSPVVMALTVTDVLGQRVGSYRGIVHFSSVDPHPTLPADYPFAAGDAGLSSYPGVVFSTAGLQTLTAADTTNPYPALVTKVHVGPAAVTTPSYTNFSVKGSTGYGQPVTFQALITGSGSGPQRGTVTFSEGGNVIGTALVDTHGYALFTTTSPGWGAPHHHRLLQRRRRALSFCGQRHRHSAQGVHRNESVGQFDLALRRSVGDVDHEPWPALLRGGRPHRDRHVLRRREVDRHRDS
jgi:hypothetical protein